MSYLFKRWFARTVCFLIPTNCPFARKVYWKNQLLLEIPPLCKLNPFYSQIMELRMKMAEYLETNH